MTRRAADDGFVLIGVIMFVLALTILGLSLYGLSSYESQFLAQSHDQNAALYEAEGGMEMVRQILADPPYSLAAADSIRLLDTAHVLRAVAWQPLPGGTLDSTGTIQFDTTVTVVVVAQEGASQRLLSARFRPRGHNDYYKRLFTSVDPTIVYPKSAPDGNSSRVNSVVLSGPVWQVDADTSQWAVAGNPAGVAWAGPHPVLHDAITAPAAVAYIQTHIAGATTVPVDTSDPANYRVSLLGPDSQTRFYTLPAGGPGWTLHAPDNMQLDVKGTAVLLLPQGMRVEGYLTVVGHAAHPRLIIVGGPNGVDLDNPRAGFWLFGGIDAYGGTAGSPDYSGMPIVVATQYESLFECHYAGTMDSHAEALAVWSSQVILTGPKPGWHFYMSYDPAVMDPIIDALGPFTLPQPSAGQAAQGFSMVPGSWQDLTP